ncbi:hypothetical protein C0989_006632, partial [Termitomyces sp. Mn162]
MSNYLEFPQRNRKYAATFDKGGLPLPPAKQFIVDAIRSIIISQRLLGTREIAIFHHTGCGMLTFTTDHLRRIVKEADPGNTAIAQAVDQIHFLEFSDLEKSVKDDVEFLKEHPLVLKDTIVTGWIYHVETGK